MVKELGLPAFGSNVNVAEPTKVRFKVQEMPEPNATFSSRFRTSRVRLNAFGRVRTKMNRRFLRDNLPHGTWVKEG